MTPGMTPGMTTGTSQFLGSLARQSGSLDERMVTDELVGVGVGPLDVGLELLGLDPPLAPTTDLDGPDLAASHQCVDLRTGDVEDLGHVGQLQEPRRRAHDRHSATGHVRLRTFDTPCLWKAMRPGGGAR